jgi:CRISPR-associated protein Cmr2
MEGMPSALKARLRLSRSEQLDAIGLTKRLGLGAVQFPSVSRVAAESWLLRLDEDSLSTLRTAAEPLRMGGLVSLGRFPQYGSFPWEGAIVYPERLKEIAPPDELPGPERVLLEKGKEGWKKALEAVRTGSGSPSAYMAILLADGDRMGKAIAGIREVKEHRLFSTRLAEFAAAAGSIVSQHRGALVFAGGDDVLALVPANAAIPCAEALRRRFKQCLSGWTDVSLSVGIGIGHCMEDLEDLLGLARGAEKLAKEPDRDGLGITYAPRGKEGRSVRRRWTEGPAVEFSKIIALFRRGVIPSKAAYELAEMARHYSKWPKAEPNLLRAMRADASRLFRRKTGGMSEPDEAWWLKLLDRRVQRPEDLATLGDQLVIARHLAEIGPEYAPAAGEDADG